MSFGVFTTSKMMFSAFLLALFSFTVGSAIPVGQRDIWDPAITYPTAGVTWTTGEQYNVTWSTANPPSEVTDATGKILLQNKDWSISVELADGFSLFGGSQEVTAPKVPAADDYHIVLMGDSGNWSPVFTVAA